jgi:hypothetical protein
VVASRALRSWGALGGVAFVVLFVIGSALIFDGPNSDETPAKFASFYGDSGNRDKINIGWILAGLGLFFFLWFVAALRETMRRLLAAETDAMLGFLVTVGGTAYAAVTMVAVGDAAGVRTMSDDTFRHQVYPGIIHANSDWTYISHATGTAALAAMIFAFSITVLTTGEGFPRWLGWFGLLAGIGALLSILFVTIFLWLLWIAVTSIVLFLSARKSRVITGRNSPAAT